MPACTRHPHEPAAWHCQKHRRHLCQACRQCRDPELYCRHRSACTIHFLGKHGDRLDETQAGRASGE